MKSLLKAQVVSIQIFSAYLPPVSDFESLFIAGGCFLTCCPQNELNARQTSFCGYNVFFLNQ